MDDDGVEFWDTEDSDSEDDELGVEKSQDDDFKVRSKKTQRMSENQVSKTE